MTDHVILVVDDDIDVRTMLCALLSAEGYNVLGASDGVEALDCMRVVDPPALVFVDLMMPRMDGEHLIRAMKQSPELARVPIVIMSGHTVAGGAARPGASAFLKKPFELDSLLTVVHELAD